ncbi:MAG: conditioned medium-induced protein 4 [Natronomonas sp.]
MDDRTAELRDVFLSVTDEEAVTEQQTEGRGSLVADREVETQLRAVIEEMQEQFSFSTTLSEDELLCVVEGFFEGTTDSELAERLGVSRRTVFRARMDLHLVRDRDAEAPFALSDLRELLLSDASAASAAEELDVSESTVRRYARVLRAHDDARRVSDRFYSAFADAFVEAGLDDSLTADVTRDGLDDATAGMENNLSF